MKTKKRFLGILLSLVMVLGLMPGMSLTAYATNSITVTWSGNDIPADLYTASATADFSKDNVTLSGARFFQGDGNAIEGGTFTTTLGNFTKIRVTVRDDTCYNTAFDPNRNAQTKEWTGNASSVSLSGFLQNMSSITFTIEPAATNYPLWVGGTQVTSANAGNIDGNNTASYDADTKTLTLNGYSFSDTGYSFQEYSGAIYAGEGLDLNLVLSGTNSVENNDYTSSMPCGIYAGGALTISGNGTLKAGSKERGISCRGKLTIIGGSVTVEGAYGHGMFVDGDVEISGGTVSVEARSDGICSQGGSVTISGGEVTAKSDDGAGVRAQNKIKITGGKVTAETKSRIGMSSSNVTIEGGEIIAIGNEKGIGGTVVNAIRGTGWTDRDGTAGKAGIAVSTAGQSLDYKKVQFPGESLPPAEVTSEFEYPVDVYLTGKDSKPGFPADMKETVLNLKLTISDGENTISESELFELTIPGTQSKQTLTVKFSKEVKDLISNRNNYKISLSGLVPSVDRNIYSSAGDDTGKYYLSMNKGPEPYENAEDKKIHIRFYLVWDDGKGSSEPEPIRVVALPEDEIGAYKLNEDGTKEYLLFHTYDICMNYLGSDELCRGYERCFHKDR